MLLAAFLLHSGFRTKAETFSGPKEKTWYIEGRLCFLPYDLQALPVPSGGVGRRAMSHWRSEA